MACDICGKELSNKYNMARHKKEYHTIANKKYIKHAKQEGHYKCKVCGKDYTHSTNLKLHMLKKHNKEEVEDSSIKTEQLFF